MKEFKGTQSRRRWWPKLCQ